MVFLMIKEIENLCQQDGSIIKIWSNTYQFMLIKIYIGNTFS